MSGALLTIGCALVALSVWTSRRGGTRARAARLMAGLSPVTPAEALALGEGRYAAVQGGIDAAEAFEDENRRPLVYRRERVLVQESGTWRELERVVRSVPFVLSEGTHAIVIDAAALTDGLVVIERQWEGSVAELAAAGREYQRAATGTLVAQLAAATPGLTARITVEQISTLDRGTASGLLRNGTLTSGGAGQPLVLTTLDRREALRILGSDRRGTLAVSLLTLGALVVGVMLSAVALIALAGDLTGATGTASPAPIETVRNPESGDARNGGVATGPGGLLVLIGALLLPLLFGVVIAVVSRAVARRRSARTRINE